jgi:hypothetical protein
MHANKGTSLSFDSIVNAIHKTTTTLNTYTSILFEFGGSYVSVLVVGKLLWAAVMY